MELPVPGLESCSGSGGVCPDPSLPDGGAMPNAAADAPLNCNDIGSDQADTRFTPLQRDGSMPDAPEAIAAADSSMVVPNTAQKSTRDAVLLEITQIRADLEQHAARRASLHAELNAAGETMQAMGQAAMPPEGSLPENSQMQDDDTMKQVAGSDTHPLPSQEGQPLPRGPSQQQAHEAILGRLSNAERSEEPLTSVRRVSWSTPEEQGHGFALLWAPLAPPPRKFPTQSSAPLPLARSNSLPAQLGSAAPDTPISWPLPPLPQQRDVLSTSQNIIQRIIRRQTGDGRSGLPPIMSAPRSHPGATARPLHLEQDGHRREALLSLAGVPETAAGQGQPMLSSQPLYMSSRSSQQFSGVPDVTTSAAYRQRPRLRSDSGEPAHGSLCSCRHNIQLLLYFMGPGVLRARITEEAKVSAAAVRSASGDCGQLPGSSERRSRTRFACRRRPRAPAARSEPVARCICKEAQCGARTTVCLMHAG